MADIIKYDTGTNWAKQYISSQDPSGYVGQNDVLIFEDTTIQTVAELRTLLETVPVRYLLVIGSPQVREMTAQEKAAVDAALLAAQTAAFRTGAISSITSRGELLILLRGILLLLMDELNVLRDWITQYKAQVAAATSLANLQTRVAALPNVPQRTNQQLRTAIIAIINNGQAD